MTHFEYIQEIETLFKEFIESVNDSVKEARKDKSREKEEYDPVYLIQTLAGSVTFHRGKYDRLQNIWYTSPREVPDRNPGVLSREEMYQKLKERSAEIKNSISMEQD